MESILVTGNSSAPPSTEILNVTWADWLNSIPTKVCYRINNWVFIKVKFYASESANFINSTNTVILETLPYPIPESLRNNQCLPIGECLIDGYSKKTRYLEGYTSRLNGSYLSFYMESGLTQTLNDCSYLNIDFCYEIEE